MTTQRSILISIIALVFISLIFFLTNLYDSNKKAEILAEKDTRLESYEHAKLLAESLQNLISIRDESTYKKQRKKFKKSMTTDLFNEYFPTEEYTEVIKTFTITKNKVTGEILNDTDFIFKVELVLEDSGAETLLTFLVHINDGIIHRIQSLG